MVSSQLNKALEDVNQIKTKMMQALKIHEMIVKTKSDALYHLEEYVDTGKKTKKYKGNFKQLEISYENEKTFMNIMKQAIPTTFEVLQTVRKDKSHKSSKEEEDIIKTILTVLEYVQDKMSKVEKRMKLEKDFIATQEDSVFKNYLLAWDNELQDDAKLLNKVDPAKIKETQMKLNVIGEYGRAAAIGAAAGAASGGVAGIITTAGSNSDLIKAGAVVFAVVGALTGIIFEYISRQYDTYQMQKKVILKFASH